MATDYDEPRRTDAEIDADSLEALTAAAAAAAAAVDMDGSDLVESLELPGADLSEERLSVLVLPRQADEFTCTVCFLLHHRSQRVPGSSADVCVDCA